MLANPARRGDKATANPAVAAQGAISGPAKDCSCQHLPDVMRPHLDPRGPDESGGDHHHGLPPALPCRQSCARLLAPRAAAPVCPDGNPCP